MPLPLPRRQYGARSSMTPLFVPFACLSLLKAPVCIATMRHEAKVVLTRVHPPSSCVLLVAFLCLVCQSQAGSALTGVVSRKAILCPLSHHVAPGIIPCFASSYLPDIWTFSGAYPAPMGYRALGPTTTQSKKKFTDTRRRACMLTPFSLLFFLFTRARALECAGQAACP